MSGLPHSTNNASGDDHDFDLDLDDLDDATLQRLLEEDPALEEELRAIEAAESARAENSEEDDTELMSDTDDASGPMAAAPFAMPTAEEELDALLVHEDLPPMGFDDLDLDADTDLDDDAEPSASEPTDPPFVAAPTHDDLAEYDYTPPMVVAEEEPSFDETTEVDETFETDLSVNVQPVPRINIHAFCATERMTGLIEAAAGDRRLAKAHVTLQSGDARRAAEIYSNDSTPNLLILEAGDSSQALLDGLDALAQVCDPSTRVIIVGDINDIRLYRELINRGISEYIVRPSSPLQIISSIGSLYADPDAPPIGKTFVFVGARGGSGSSSICHNVAWSLAEEMRSDTVLMDLDLAFGTAGLDFEHDPSQGLAEALAAPERLDDVLLDRLLQKCTERLSLFAAPNLLDRDYDMPTESFEAVIDTVKASAPCIAVDLPHVWTGWARMMLQSADEIILTATPDLSSFRNAKNIVETIKSHRTNDAPPILVLNQVGVPKRPEVPAEQFEEALGLTPRAILPWDPVTFGTCATNAEPLMEVAPKAKVTQEVSRIARILMGRDLVEQTSAGFSLKSLFAKKS
ncbi:pilus assembly protein CpaE [Parvularcula sp. LCG005]|uniref:AAA family ATPase n=1 Tax=Parvularcula sp. LCG005 TaxID=3078805 RepID=UPI002943C89C|nr:pilus assembly protein CpaE [Parvularcula sp. LCG005]WOI53565.1 pilus assembly protein CpaE [Parvularcula sp. LCG005]